MEKNKNNHILKVYRYFLPSAFKKYKGYFFVRVMKLIVTTLLPFIPILITPRIVDELLGSRDAGKIMDYVLFLLGAEFILNLLNGILGNLIERYAVKFENYYKAIMSRRIMELDFQLTEDKKALDQIELARNGMSWYSGGLNGIVEPLFNMASALFTLLGVVVIVACNAPMLIVVTAGIIILTAIVNGKRNQIEQKHYAELSKENRIFNYMAWGLTDFRYGKDIRLYGAREMMVEKWKHHSGIMSGQWETMANKQLPLELIMAFLNIVRDFGSYFYLGVLAITGRITIGVTTQMLTAGGSFYSAMQSLITSYQDLQKRTNYANEYVKFMDYPARLQKGNRQVKKGEHTFELRNVCFSYPGAEVSVLKGVNLTLTPGEHLAVVGINGAGKTTLIKLLCRLYEPTEGEILLDGVNIKEYDYEEYMELFAPVFQDFKLFAFSMKENLTLKAFASHEEEARTLKVIEQAGLAAKLETLQEGANTMLFKHFDKDGIEPSGGEQQKLAIARALYKDAPVVILDEPTAALDPMAEYEIYRQFENLVKGKIAIYISHRLSSCQFCDRIAVFSDGVVKEYGTHAELVNQENGIYAEMFAAQAQYYYG